MTNSTALNHEVSTQQVVAQLIRIWPKLSGREIGYYASGKRSEFLYVLQNRYKLTREQAEDALGTIERQSRQAS